MTSGMNFWDAPVWSFIITMTLLFLGMMAANILRNNIKPLRQLMIPSSVLGGFLLLIAGWIYKEITGNPLMNVATLEMLTYHGLGLGFVAMSLRKSDKTKNKYGKNGGFNSAIATVTSYLLQAVLGLVISIALFYIIGSFWASGLILPMGFGQGPGQAYNWGRTYENVYGFDFGTSFGLTVAALGFIAASVGGVIYINILRKKGEFTGETGKNVTDQELTAASITGNDEIPLSESMDKFSVQLALVFITYAITYFFMLGINAIINTGVLGNFGYNTVQPLIWGFNFLFGTVFAMLMKAVLNWLKKKNIIQREYTNDFMQNRISGFMFDIMVIASIAAINLSAFTHPQFIVPLIIICVVGTIATYIYLDIYCKHAFPEYKHEAFLSLYGMLTGTASTGIILLREKDPNYDTPAANNLVTQQLWAILMGFPMLLLLSVAPQSVGKAFMTLGILILLLIVMMILGFRKLLFKKKSKNY